MKMPIAPLFLVACWAGGCAAPGVIPGEARNAEFDRTPRECISTTRISRTEVLDEQTILFHMHGRALYRNLLANDCTGLDRGDPLMYRQRSTAPELCKGDSIDVLERFGGGYAPGRSCVLGSFYPMTQEELADIKRTGPAAITVSPVESGDGQSGAAGGGSETDE